MSQTQFMTYKDFPPSVSKLKQKGGKYQKAADAVLSAVGMATTTPNATVAQVFHGIAPTNHGENRIMHCRKYDLTGFARLVTAFSNNVCIFLFAGDHAETDKWLDANKGLDFIVREVEGRQEIAPVFVSDLAPGQRGAIASHIDWMHGEPLLDMLLPELRQKLLMDLPENHVARLREIYSYTDEDLILGEVDLIPAEEQKLAVLDVMLKLRSGDLKSAVTRVDLYVKKAKPVAEIAPPELEKVVSGESVVLAKDVDPVLFEHFVNTANFRDWMLYLHPAQREIVHRNFSGPARLAGVSGSGKTAVIIHRALRLAQQNPQAKVLVLTLNHALAKLILELVQAASAPHSSLNNLRVASVFTLCAEKLRKLVPARNKQFSNRTFAPNPFVEAEHIDDIWDEYFKCRANNADADIMFDVVRTLLVRNVLPQEYLRQELDYIRSAFSEDERRQYLKMERAGRTFALTERYRELVLQGLQGWERKMAAVGAIDDLGVVDELYRHLPALEAEFDHVLVDEVQDLGTLELKIIRNITKAGPNDLFLAGDAVQAVHTKYSDLKAAGIDLPGARSLRLTQNYRNSRQILSAAYSVLDKNSTDVRFGQADLEVLIPEYANFSSAKPLLLCASSLAEEVSLALGYIKSQDVESPDRKSCLAICGYTQKMVEELGAELNMAVLNDVADLTGGRCFLSDLEQTKGFEFDLMIVVNCSAQVLPHPQLPEHEAFRELCKLYVALTRAKRELVVSYSGAPSIFLSGSEDYFSQGSWLEHEVPPVNLLAVHWPDGVPGDQDLALWDLAGRDFLRQREVVGLSTAAQDAILTCVSGRSLSRKEAGRMKVREWVTFREFFSVLSRDPRARVNVISAEAWDEISQKFREAVQTASVAPAPRPVDPSPSHASSAGHDRTVAAPVGPGKTVTMDYLEIFRHQGAKTYTWPTMLAQVMAALLVAQNCTRVEDLKVAEPINREILEFLVPSKALRRWMVEGWLRPLRNDATRLVLTKTGWDECRHLTSPVEGAQQREVHIGAGRIEAFRAAILNGPTKSDGSRYDKRTFALDKARQLISPRSA